MAIVKGTNQTETIDKSDGTTDDADVIFGLGGHDIISAAGGDDLIKGGGGADTINGGAGIDTAAYTLSEEGVSVSLSTGRGSGGEAEGDILIWIENLAGSGHDDQLWGDHSTNVIEGIGGADTLKGFGGADHVYGGRDNDILVGGEGNDLLDGGLGADFMAGGEGDDTYYVDELNDLVNEIACQGADTVLVSASYYFLREGVEVETLAAADPYAGSYSLAGNSGSNLIIGNEAENVLNGAGGRDVLTGNSDADTFEWSSATHTGTTAATADVIADFDHAEGDRIHLHSIDADIYAAGDQAFTFIGQAAFSGTPGELRYYHAGGDTYIEMQTGQSADVEGVIRLSGIHTPEASWFVL